MNCASCGDSFNDGVQCTACQSHYDFGCAQITEIGWRRLGVDRRSTWTCPACRKQTLASPQPPPSPTTDPITLERVFAEICELKKQLMGLPTILNDVKVIKIELTELRHTSEFMSGRLDDFAAKIKEIDNRVTKVENLQKSVCTLESEIHHLKSQLSSTDQRSRLNNVEIKGVPIKKEENLFKIVESICKATNTTYMKTQINFLHRTPMHGTKDKAIIVSFLNRYAKDDFVAAARACKSLSASELGYTNSNQRVYVNDHLNSDSKLLLNKTKAKSKETGFKYVWVKHGKIHARKNDTCPVIIISKEQDLNKML